MLAIEASITFTHPSVDCCRASNNPFIACIVIDDRVNSLLISIPSSMLKTGQIPRQVCDLTGLYHLSIDIQSSTTPAEIPGCLHNLTNLVSLNLSGLNVSSALTGITRTPFQWLTNLEISNAEMTSQNLADIANLTTLTTLNILSTRLPTVIPESLCSLPVLGELELSGDSLIGEIPACLSRLRNLTTLNLSMNELHGSVPDLRNLSNLEILDVSGNKLNGAFPLSLCNYTSLRTVSLYRNELWSTLPDCVTRLSKLDLHGNVFFGPLPAPVFAENSSLSELDLSHNSFTGPLPELANARMLVLRLASNRINGTLDSQKWEGFLSHLDLSANSITGILPPAMGNSTFLSHIDLSGNLLRGGIPEAFGNLHALNSLDVMNNNLSGGIGPWIDKVQGSLQVLRLGNNKFSGRVPKSLSLFRVLTYIDLSNNRFEGNLPELSIDLPTSLGAGTVEYLDFSSNNFDGPIPASLDTFTSLIYLNLSRNHLVGEIPEYVVSMDGLQTVDLSHNHLSGGIPQSLVNLSHLIFFDVSDNRLTGPIPSGGQFNFSSISFSGNSGLCGFPLDPCNPVPGGRARRTVLKNKLYVTLAVIGSCVVTTLLVTVCYLVKHRRAFASREKPAVIGSGGSSTIYKGVLKEGTVAIKVFKPSSTEQFFREKNILSKVHHRNLIRMFNSCFELGFKALILDFMDNGSLEKQLHELSGAKLHEELDCSPVVHWDLKPSNILLDKNMEPRVGDFGLARHSKLFLFCFTNSVETSEFASEGKVTTAGDVYSYGVMMLEMLVGVRLTSSKFEKLSLRSWFCSYFEHDQLMEALDPVLAAEAASSMLVKSSIETFARTAVLCSHPSAQARPAMREVSEILAVTYKLVCSSRLK